MQNILSDLCITQLKKQLKELISHNKNGGFIL